MNKIEVSIVCSCGNSDRVTPAPVGSMAVSTNENKSKPIYLFTEGSTIKFKCLACNEEYEI